MKIPRTAVEGDAAKAPDVYSPLVRVNLTPNPTASVCVSADGPWTAHPLGSDRILARGDRLSEAKVVPTRAGFQLGSHALNAARIELRSEKSPVFWVDEHQYRGEVRLFRRPENRLIAVNALPLEEYVASVVNGEMPASFPDEARKTQAILARSYGVFRVAEARGHPEFDLYATTRSQKYLGVQYKSSDGRRLAGESEASRRLTAETAGVVCTSSGRVFSTYYCAVCGGQTIDGSNVFTDAAACIRGVSCDWCQAASLYRWTTRLSRKQATEALSDFFKGRGESFSTLKSLDRADDAEPGPSKKFQAADGEKTRSVSAAELRRLMPASTLPSPFFSVKNEGEDLVFTGRGHGHGVGVCQWGARGLALEQKDCFDILRHYYPGVRFVVMEPPTNL